MLTSHHILQCLIDAGPKDSGPFVVALAQGISDAMPTANEKIPFTQEGVTFLEKSVSEALSLFLATQAKAKLINPSNVNGFEPEAFKCSNCARRFSVELRAPGRDDLCDDCDDVAPGHDDHDAACDAARDEARERDPND